MRNNLIFEYRIFPEKRKVSISPDFKVGADSFGLIHKPCISHNFKVMTE